MNCALVQLNQPVDLSFVYRNYPYRTGKTATMRRQLSQVIDFALRDIALEPNDIILDIGGNDGTLLSHFENSTYQLVNFDLASGVDQVVSSTNYVYLNREFSAAHYATVFTKNPKLIFCTAVFYQIRDLNQFCLDLSKLMNEETVLVMQFTYLGTMYRNRIFDNVVHEHLTYFSLSSLKWLLMRFNLHITDAEIVETYGGSLRVKIQKTTKRFVCSSVEQILSDERIGGTNTIEKLRQFGIDFNHWITSFKDFYSEHNFYQARVFGLGASTKGNMLLQALGFGASQIECIWDNSSEKIGLFTNGTNIIIEAEDFSGDLPDAFLVLPYYYFDAFKDMIAQKIPSDRSVKLIVPLPFPRFEVVSGLA